MVTIILAHPWHGSFNKAVLDSIVVELNKTQREFEIIDLYKDNFNPALSEKELAVYMKGQTLDPLVVKYQNIVKKTTEIILLFPVWWMGMPAMLKGFFDKVMLVDFAWYYDRTEGKLKPLLNINKTTVITTSEETNKEFSHVGSPIESSILNCMTAVGIFNAKWMNCERISSGDNSYRENFIKEVLSVINK